MAVACALVAPTAMQCRSSKQVVSSCSSAQLRPLSGQHQRAARRRPGCLRVRAVLTAEKSELDVSKMSPLGDRLLVKPQEVETKSAGGILLAPTASGGRNMQDALIGTVMAKGDEVDIEVAVGDRVLFSKYSSSDVEVPDGEVCFVAQKSILAKLS